jgi:hypothetical protein
MASRLSIEDDGAPQDRLPDPDSEELRALVRDESVRLVYRVLYETRATPLTMQEIRQALGPEIGTPEQLDRRKRDLHPFFVIEKIRTGREVRYRISHQKAQKTDSESLGISQRLRAEVLQHGRCAMCGRTPLEDGIKLVVDHKRPQAWGGTNDAENLQPLCEECNAGKKHYFETIDRFGQLIQAASAYDEPQKRVGEMLKRVYPEEVRSDVLEMVAHAGAYQEDWQRRLRELRALGWKIKWRKKKDETGRMRVYWRVEEWQDWPDSVRDELTRIKRKK